MTVRWPIAPLLGVILLVGLAAPAAAEEPSGVVLRFRGPGGAAARKVVVRAVGDELSLVPQAQVERRARKLRARLSQARGRARVAEDMGLQVFLEGRVRGRGKARRVRLRVYGADGARAVEREASTSDELAGAAVEAVREVLGQAPSADAADEGSEEELPDAPVEDESPVAALAVDDESQDDEVPSAPSAHGPLFLMYGAGGIGSREARVSLAGGGRRAYESGPFPELGLGLELRPLRTSGPLARGLFFSTEAAFVVGLEASTQAGDSVSTTAYRFGLALGHRFEAGALSLGPVLAFAYEVFAFGDNDVMPDASYASLEPGAVLRLGLLSGDALYVEAGGAYRAVLSAGDMESAFGESLTARGFRIGLSLGGLLGGRFLYGARFSVVRTSLDHKGTGSVATGDGGHDRTLAGHLMVGAAL